MVKSDYRPKCTLWPYIDNFRGEMNLHIYTKEQKNHKIICFKAHIS